MSRRAPWVFALALLAGRPAHAAEGRPFRLAYSAPEGCPTKDGMSSRIVAGTARARPADPIEPAVELGASVVAESGGFMGYLRVRTLDGRETTRAVPAATCDESVSAMALIAAIVIDPDAMLPSAEAPDETAPVAPPSVPPPPPAPAEATRTEVARARKSESVARVPRYWAVLDAEVGATGTIAPDLAPDLAVGVGFVDTRRALLAPALRLSFRWAKSADVVSTEGTARLERLGGRLSGCPVRIEVGPLGFRPCTFLELGTLRASTSKAVDPNNPAVFWGAFGLTVRGESLLFGRFILGLELGGLVPFSHDTFYYLPGRVVAHQVDVGGFTGAFDVGVRFL